MSIRILKVLAIAIALVVALPVHAEEGASDALARKLLDVSGSGEIGKQVMDEMIGQMRAMAPPSVPAEFWDGVLAKYDAQELIDKIVPIYTRHLSTAEMQAAIDFYSTPEGKMIIEKMPTIMTESMMAGQEWGMSIAGEVMQDIQKMEADSAAAEGPADGS